MGAVGLWRLQQQIKQAKALLPVLARRVLQIGIDNLEGASKRDAQTSRNLGQVILDILAVSDVKGWPRSSRVVEDGPQLDLFVQLLPNSWRHSCMPLVIGRSKGLP